MDNDIQIYKDKGLTEDEALVVQNWHDRGRPGAARINHEVACNLYAAGYSCLEIHKYFKDYPYEGLLWSRITLKWDEIRLSRKAEILTSALPGASNAQAEGIKLITEIISATHTNWREQIVAYLANPTQNEPPECLPKSLHQYGALQLLLKDMLTPIESKSGGAAGTPLVSVNVSSGGTVEIKPGDAKSALKKSLGKGTK